MNREPSAAVSTQNRKLPGALVRGGQAQFLLYAPNAGRAEVHLDGGERIAMSKGQDGYFVAEAALAPGTRYRFRTDQMRAARPDPASRYQPEGVHASSELLDEAVFQRRQPEWQGLTLENMAIYELHIGTFTEEGTLESAAQVLPDLVKLGINAVQLMPINQFAGTHNWGYDGVYWQAVQHSYGGPEGLIKFIDEAHDLGLAVIIDAVFNHLGPEGNYLPEFAPYLTDKHHTPWGAAINLDDYHSDGIRDLILATAKTWLVDYGADGLRLDAVHALKDSGALHLLEELSQEVKHWARELRRPLTLIAECDLNDPRYVTPASRGGLGLQGQWVDEFHHALRAYLTQERSGYYADFGDREQLLRALRQGYVFTGQYSRHRGRRFGRPNDELRSHQLVVFGQNHDQVGNRALGERLHHHLSEKQYLLVAATVIWSPFTPMLFQGEEYREEAPFPYFVSHSDEHVLEATRAGRQREFAPFLKGKEEVPDPGAVETFRSAKLSHRRQGRTYSFYREALAVRRQFWPLRQRSLGAHDVEELHDDVIAWRIPLSDGRRVMVIVNYSNYGWPTGAASGGWSLQGGDLRCSTHQLEREAALHDALTLPAHSAAVWLMPTTRT